MQLSRDHDLHIHVATLIFSWNLDQILWHMTVDSHDTSHFFTLYWLHQHGQAANIKRSLGSSFTGCQGPILFAHSVCTHVRRPLPSLQTHAVSQLSRHQRKVFGEKIDAFAYKTCRKYVPKRVTLAKVPPFVCITLYVAPLDAFVIVQPPYFQRQQQDWLLFARLSSWFHARAATKQLLEDK